MSMTPVTTEGSEDAPGLLGTLVVLKSHATAKRPSLSEWPGLFPGTMETLSRFMPRSMAYAFRVCVDIHGACCHRGL